MKAIRLSFLQMLSFIKRDFMLFILCFVPILCGSLFKFGIPQLESLLCRLLHCSKILVPYYPLFDMFFAIISPIMYCFAAAMIVLEETDIKIATYLFTTPLGKKGYVLSRIGIPDGIAFVITLLLFPVFHLTSFYVIRAILLCISGMLQGIIISLMIITLSSNKLEGMAVAKISTLTSFGCVVPFFISGNMQYLLSFLPSFWIGKLIYEDTLLYILPVIACSLLWIAVLMKRFLRKIV